MQHLRNRPQMLYRNHLQKQLNSLDALTKNQGEGSVLPILVHPKRFVRRELAPSASTSAASTSTATARWISSIEITTRKFPFRRSRIPTVPASGPLLTLTFCPAVKYGCGSGRRLRESPACRISISVSGSAVGNPPKPTSRTTLGIRTTRIRSRNASRTNTYPGKSGRSNVTRRSFHRRTELYIGRKCSTSRAPSSAATRFSWFANVYPAYHRACDIACSSETTALCCRSSTLGVLPGINVMLATHPPLRLASHSFAPSLTGRYVT